MNLKRLQACCWVRLGSAGKEQGQLHVWNVNFYKSVHRGSKSKSIQVVTLPPEFYEFNNTKNYIIIIWIIWWMIIIQYYTVLYNKFRPKMLWPRWNRREAMEVSERLGVKIWNVASRNWSLENSSWHLEDGDTTKVPDAGNGWKWGDDHHVTTHFGKGNLARSWNCRFMSGCSCRHGNKQLDTSVRVTCPVRVKKHAASAHLTTPSSSLELVGPFHQWPLKFLKLPEGGHAIIYLFQRISDSEPLDDI